MTLEDLSSEGSAKLAAQEAEVLRRGSVLRAAEAAYSSAKPQFDAQRRTYPSVLQEEIRMIQGLGRVRDDLQLARAELLHLRGEGPCPKTWVELVDGKMPMDFTATLAEQSRAEVGRLDSIEP